MTTPHRIVTPQGLRAFEAKGVNRVPSTGIPEHRIEVRKRGDERFFGEDRKSPVDHQITVNTQHINFAPPISKGGNNFTNGKALALPKVNRAMAIKSHPLSNKAYEHNQMVVPEASQQRRTEDKMEMLVKLLTESEMAELVSVNKRTMRRFRKREMVPFIRLGRLIRYDRQEVARALKAYRVGRQDK